MVINNKKAWTSLIEVFASILLIAGIMAIVINSNAVQKPKLSEQIYKEQAQILKVIQMDDDLRAKVLDNRLSIEDEKIKQTIPDYLDCDLNNIPAEAKDKEIYAKSVMITATLDEYAPKELKLFCWEK